MQKPTHLDFYSGIGGFTLASEWAGFETLAFSEINEWCIENALKRNWPHIPNLGSITELDLSNDTLKTKLGHIDLLTAGVPCQPASIIGKRKGAEDSRWLWPVTLRVIEYFRPEWVVCENPTGLLTLDKGERFRDILKGIQQAGYDVWWETIAASAVGGGHRRERTWLVAYSSVSRLEGHSGHGSSLDRQEWKSKNQAGSVPEKIVFQPRTGETWFKDQCPVPPLVHGVSNPAFWKQAIIATGNTIVPQVAYQILKGIQEIT